MRTDTGRKKKNGITGSVPLNRGRTLCRLRPYPVEDGGSRTSRILRRGRGTIMAPSAVVPTRYGIRAKPSAAAARLKAEEWAWPTP